MDDAFRCSRATHVHMEDLRLVNLTEFHPRYVYEEISLLMLWMDLCMSQQSNLKSLKKPYNNSLIH